MLSWTRTYTHIHTLLQVQGLLLAGHAAGEHAGLGQRGGAAAGHEGGRVVRVRA